MVQVEWLPELMTTAVLMGRIDVCDGAAQLGYDDQWSMPSTVALCARADRLLLQRLKRSSSSNQMLLWADAASQAGASDAPPTGGGRDGTPTGGGPSSAALRSGSFAGGNGSFAPNGSGGLSGGGGGGGGGGVAPPGPLSSVSTAPAALDARDGELPRVYSLNADSASAHNTERSGGASISSKLIASLCTCCGHCQAVNA